VVHPDKSKKKNAAVSSRVLVFHISQQPAGTSRTDATHHKILHADFSGCNLSCNDIKREI